MSMLQAVKPTKPAAPYLGGKRRLAKTLVEKINSIPHKSYCEPFCGMGGVFFTRDKKPPCEVINDLNGDVANFFRILQRHYQPLCEMLQYAVTSRSEFERLKAIDPSQLTDLERAYRFVFLQKAGFGGHVIGRSFGVKVGEGPLFHSQRLMPILEKLNQRLCSVVIECLSYSDCIKRYDRPDTLFYLDPPYWGTEKSYGKDLFDQADFEKIAKQLETIKGKFVLSINDTPEIREIFSSFNMESLDVRYTVSLANPIAARELMISNVN